MAIENVQTFSDGTGHYRQSTQLDGVVFILIFHFNSRDGNWYLTLHDSEDNPINGCVGRKLVANYPVTWRSVDDRRPKGDLLVVNARDNDDPGLFDLSDGTILTYVPESDGAVLLAEAIAEQ